MWAASLLLLFTACERPEVEIVEYDDSYSLDEKFIKVDIPKETNYDPTNYFKVEGSSEVILATNIVDGKGNMVNKEIPLVIRLRRALDEDLTIVLKEDRERLVDYPGISTGIHSFPEGALKSEYRITIPAGKTMVEESIAVQDATNLTAPTGYLTAFALTTEEKDKITPSNLNSTLYVRVIVSALIPKQNISYINEELAGSAIPSSQIRAESNYRGDHVHKLFNGSTWMGSEYWVQRDSDTYIITRFSKTTVTGVVFMCVPGPKGKSLKAVTIEVSDDGGSTWIPQGSISYPDVEWDVNVQFNEPVEINAIRFTKFDTHSNDPNDLWLDMSEIQIFQQD